MIGIYKMINPNGRVYIGQSIDLDKRKSEYQKIYAIKGQPKIYHSLIKYGFENHKFEIIEECSLEQINKREIYWISFYNSVDEGLNCLHGGIGGNKNEETKKKISKSMKGKNNWSTGGYNKKPISQYTLSGEFIKEWENSSLPNINNIGMCANGLIKSAGGFIWIYTKDFTPSLLEERVNKCKTHANLNKSKSIQHSQNISKSKKNLPKKGKHIFQYDLNNNFIQEWNSIKEASISLKICKGGISSVLTGRYKTCGNFIFKYSNTSLVI
jgi:group I intron endonuclease